MQRYRPHMDGAVLEAALGFRDATLHFRKS